MVLIPGIVSKSYKYLSARDKQMILGIGSLKEGVFNLSRRVIVHSKESCKMPGQVYGASFGSLTFRPR